LQGPTKWRYHLALLRYGFKPQILRILALALPTIRSAARAAIAGGLMVSKLSRQAGSLTNASKNRREVGCTLASFVNFAFGNIHFLLLRAYPAQVIFAFTWQLRRVIQEKKFGKSCTNRLLSVVTFSSLLRLLQRFSY